MNKAIAQWAIPLAVWFARRGPRPR